MELGKPEAACGKGSEIRSLDFTAIGGDVGVAHVNDHDDDDVGLFHRTEGVAKEEDGDGDNDFHANGWNLIKIAKSTRATSVLPVGILDFLQQRSQCYDFIGVTRIPTQIIGFLRIIEFII